MRVVFFLPTDDTRSTLEKARNLDTWIEFVQSHSELSMTMILTGDHAEELLFHSKNLELIDIVFHPRTASSAALAQWRSALQEHADWAIFVDISHPPSNREYFSQKRLGSIAIESKDHILLEQQDLNFLSTPWVVTRQGRKFLLQNPQIETPFDPRLQRTQLASPVDSLYTQSN